MRMRTNKVGHCGHGGEVQGRSSNNEFGDLGGGPLCGGEKSKELYRTIKLHRRSSFQYFDWWNIWSVAEDQYIKTSINGEEASYLFIYVSCFLYGH